jgi:putative hydrolase of the HAD superfamily
MLEQLSHLLIDADDTLWENNIYFEQAFHKFVQFLGHSSLQPAEIRTILESIDRRSDYGSVSFTHSMVETYCRLAERKITEEDIRQVQIFGEQIIKQPITLLSGVQDTLAALSLYYDLVLVTKGDPNEQLFKVERSGLESYFTCVIVVPEKDVQAYQHIVKMMQLDSSRTWMIGNSPRSDINPALVAGLNAIFIPHPHTWHLEDEEILTTAPGHILTFESFIHLRDFFLKATPNPTLFAQQTPPSARHLVIVPEMSTQIAVKTLVSSQKGLGAQ